MPTVFKHELVQDIGIIPIDALTVGSGVRATVIGCNLANTTDYDTVVADIQIFGVDTTVTYYVRGLIIPPNTAVKVITQGEKLILPADTGIRITADTSDSIDATISYVEIS